MNRLNIYVSNHKYDLSKGYHGFYGIRSILLPGDKMSLCELVDKIGYVVVFDISDKKISLSHTVIIGHSIYSRLLNTHQYSSHKYILYNLNYEVIVSTLNISELSEYYKLTESYQNHVVVKFHVELESMSFNKGLISILDLIYLISLDNGEIKNLLIQYLYIEQNISKLIGMKFCEPEVDVQLDDHDSELVKGWLDYVCRGIIPEDSEIKWQSKLLKYVIKINCILMNLIILM